MQVARLTTGGGRAAGGAAPRRPRDTPSPRRPTGVPPVDASRAFPAAPADATIPGRAVSALSRHGRRPHRGGGGKTGPPSRSSCLGESPGHRRRLVGSDIGMCPMSLIEIRDRLVSEGSRLMGEPRAAVVRFAGQPHADALLNDIEDRPYAFVLACVMVQQFKAELAWLIPYRLAQKLGHFSFPKLTRLPLATIKRLMSRPEPLHRFPDVMSINLHSAIRTIDEQYEGDAARIWADRPSSADVILRFLGFRGVGPKIATMAANILARQFKVPFSDHYCIDISADVHVKRVFHRLGLVRAGASVEEIQYRARSLSPQFPGLLDFPAWQVGREWCRPSDPLCTSCYMADICPTASGSGPPSGSQDRRPRRRKGA